MVYNISPGIQNTEKSKVTHEQLASELKTGDIPFIATPALIIFMEKVVCNLIHNKLPNGLTSVSVEINIKHMIPVEEGAEISCSVHLKFAEEGKLFFDFAIFNSDKDIVAIGAHERIIVAKEGFSS